VSRNACQHRHPCLGNTWIRLEDENQCRELVLVMVSVHCESLACIYLVNNLSMSVSVKMCVGAVVR
jgi:hypothetical protein